MVARVQKRRISERQIEVFRALMLTRTLSAAAQQLYVSQPALSVTLRRFEDLLGARLFERIAGRLVPTAEAHRILAEIEKVHGQFDRLLDAIQAIARGDGGSFRSGASPSVCERLVPAALAHLDATARAADKAPPRYHRDVLGEREIRDYLWFGRGACVASIAPLRDSGIASRRIAVGRLVALVPPGHPLHGRARLTRQDLAGKRLIGFEDESVHGRFITQAFAGAPPDVAVRARVVHLAIGLAREGLGVALVDSFSALAAADAGLRVVPLARSVPIPLQVYWSRHHPRPRGTDAFIEALEAVVRRG
jgi:DNA-binding transcriptional LysR family regulator